MSDTSRSGTRRTDTYLCPAARQPLVLPRMYAKRFRQRYRYQCMVRALGSDRTAKIFAYVLNIFLKLNSLIDLRASHPFGDRRRNISQRESSKILAGALRAYFRIESSRLFGCCKRRGFGQGGASTQNTNAHQGNAILLFHQAHIYCVLTVILPCRSHSSRDPGGLPGNAEREPPASWWLVILTLR
jgi:hypothetical protein